MPATGHLGDDDFSAQIRQAFLEDAEDRLQAIEAALAAAQESGGGGPETLALVRREAHSLKGMGTPSGFPVITAVAHRLENYLEDQKRLAANGLADVGRYVDVMQDVIAARDNPADDDAAARLLRRLPRTGQPGGAAAARDAEALVVVASRVLGRALARALAHHGVGALTTQSAIEGFHLALSNRPDFIVVSPTLATVSGIDLLRAFAAMSATARIPVAVLSSRDMDDLVDHGLPQQVPVIRIGDTLAVDLAGVIARYALA